MCEKCEKLDERIGHYRHLLSLIVDQQALDGIKLLIEKHEADKKALHPSH